MSASTETLWRLWLVTHDPRALLAWARSLDGVEGDGRPAEIPGGQSITRQVGFSLSARGKSPRHAARKETTEMRLTDIHEETWDGEGVPFGIELAPEDKPKLVAQQVPGAVLLAAHDEQWLKCGLEPPKRTVAGLRRVLETRARAAMAARPQTQLRPLSEAAFELGVPERTLRSQVVRGVRGAQRNARGVIELPASSVAVLRLDHLSPRPDPRVLVHMAKARVQPGEEFEWQIAGEQTTRSYRRRADGECLREKW